MNVGAVVCDDGADKWALEHELGIRDDCGPCDTWDPEAGDFLPGDGVVPYAMVSRAVIIWAVEAQADGFDRLVKQVYKASGEPWDKPSYEFRDRGDRLVVYDADDHHVIGVACAFCGEQLARDQCYCECHDGPGCQMSKFRYPAP